MIRINLLTSAQERAAVADARRRAWTLLVGGPALLVVVLTPVGWWSWALHAEAGVVSRSLANVEATLRRLAPDVEAVQAAEALRADLGARVARIEDLRARRETAGRMLDGLGRVVPDDLWFREIREEPDGFAVHGYAGTLAAVSDYVAILETAGHFDGPVEIVDSQRREWSGGREIVRFEVRLSFPGAVAGR